MAVMNLAPMEFQEAPIIQNDILVQAPYLDGGHPNAVRPLENLRNRYYGLAQSTMIARTTPPVKAKITPVTLNQSGFGSTYRLSDEALRQYSLGTFIQRALDSYYQTRP
jgi:hypothetical protein